MQEEQADVGPELKRALRGMAASVAIISTVDGDGQRYAMAATAVTPLSMEPASMLVCVNRNSSCYEPLSKGSHFIINILAADQVDVAQCCGGGARGDDRFVAGDWALTERGLPYLRDAQTSMSCSREICHSYGSHDVFIGNVEWVRHGAENDPLIYLDGAYRRSGASV